MELERGECLSPVCNNEKREGLSQCIRSSRILVHDTTHDPDDQAGTPVGVSDVSPHICLNAQLPLRLE